MKKVVTITYEWWNTDTLSFAHKETLEEDAMERIVPMMKDGFTSGELHSAIDDKELKGHWSINTKTVEG